MFYALLARLDAYFVPLVCQMEDIIASEGEDYRLYTPKSKRLIAACASTAGSIKAVLDTPLLNEEGSLTSESESVAAEIESKLTGEKRLTMRRDSFDPKIILSHC